MTEENKGLTRRTVVKGAAWSVPVIAVAVGTPLASASHGGPHLDVGVTAQCAGNYDLGVLGTLLDSLGGIGDAARTTITAGLSAIGLTPMETRAFTITAVEGIVPAGTQFNLTVPDGLIDLSLLGPVLTANALNLVTINNNVVTIALGTDLAEGTSRTINLATLPVDASVAGTTSLALVGTDNPTEAPGAPNSASLTLISADVTLADLPGVGTTLGLLLGNATLTVQLCPGQTLP